MTVSATKLNGVLLFTPDMHSDERGFFYESFNQAQFDQAVGGNTIFVQDNQSQSRAGVVRGLHYQIAPKAQGKLVRVSFGEVFCVAVDLRVESPTYLDWLGVVLDSTRHQQLWIPPGFAHGYCVTSEGASFSYKTTDYYSPEHERSILWNDPDLKIDWRLSVAPILSKKDLNAPTLRQSKIL